MTGKLTAGIEAAAGGAIEAGVAIMMCGGVGVGTAGAGGGAPCVALDILPVLVDASADCSADGQAFCLPRLPNPRIFDLSQIHSVGSRGGSLRKQT